MTATPRTVNTQTATPQTAGLRTGLPAQAPRAGVFTAAVRLSPDPVSRGPDQQARAAVIDRFSHAIHDRDPDVIANEAVPQDGRHDFDFLYGRWSLMNRRLRQRFAGLDQQDPQSWDVFTGYGQCSPQLDGIANVEELRFPARGFSGMTLRLYDINAAAWRIWWVNSADGLLQAPVAGRFHTDAQGQRHGILLGDDTDAGYAVKVRYRWQVDEIAPRWAQDFSRDNGISWECNWVMDFTRVR